MKWHEHWDSNDYDLARAGLLLLLEHEEKSLKECQESIYYRAQIPTLIPTIESRIKRIKDLLDGDY